MKTKILGMLILTCKGYPDLSIHGEGEDHFVLESSTGECWNVVNDTDLIHLLALVTSCEYKPEDCDDLKWNDGDWSCCVNGEWFEDGDSAFAHLMKSLNDLADAKSANSSCRTSYYKRRLEQLVREGRGGEHYLRSGIASSLRSMTDKQAELWFRLIGSQLNDVALTEKRRAQRGQYS